MTNCTDGMKLHDRPCGECIHYSPDGERAGICRKNLMRVTAAMHVTYWVDRPELPGRYGLCFEPAGHAERTDKEG